MPPPAWAFLETKWLRFDRLLPRRPRRLTDEFSVFARMTGVELGMIRWHGAWRQYVFEPRPDCIFNRTCLREIADVCDRETRAR